jgi:hypothetical protein
MTASTAPITGPQTAQLLVALYEYVVRYVGGHPALLPAVPALREAAQSYGRRDWQRALQKGVEVYQYLVRIRATSPDLPLP